MCVNVLELHNALYADGFLGDFSCFLLLFFQGFIGSVGSI